MDQNYDYNKPNSSATSSIIIIVLLLGIIGFEAWYIYNDSLKGPEPVPQVEVKELVKFDSTQFTENPGENEYYKLLNYENGELKLDFKLFTKENNEDINIKADMFVKNIKIGTILVDTYFKCEDDESVECPNGGENFDDKKAGAIKRIKKSIGTIKGDKYYLYMIFDEISNESNSSIYIINANGDFLENKLQFFGRNIYETYLTCNSDCKMSEYLIKRDEIYMGNYAATEDAIYYFKLSKYEKGEEDKVFANSYKLTINDNKVSKEKIETCKVNVADLRTETDLYDFKYEDM